MRDLGRHRGKHHCSLLSLAPITFDANTFSCYGGSYFATVAVILVLCRRPLNVVGPSMPTSSLLLMTAIIAYYSEYVPLQNCLLPLSLPPLRALQLSTPTFPSSFFRVTSHEHGACPPRLYTIVYFVLRTSLRRSRYWFLFFPTDRSEGSHSCFPLQPHSRRNIDGFRLYVCS
jgi:hypothetical protein